MKTALSIAGTDPSGGAGIQADLKTFALHGVYGMAVTTAIVAQNTRGVTASEPVSRRMLEAQLDAVFGDIMPDAVKIGMVPDEGSCRAIADALRRYKPKHIVIDTVMVSSSGFRLLDPCAEAALKDELLPLATLVTPNIPEAKSLCGFDVRDRGDMERAAEAIRAACGASALVKGGHLTESSDDFLLSGDCALWLPSLRVETKNTHGTGCTLSSAIAANLAEGRTIPEAVARAKRYLTGALSTGLSLGSGHGPLDHGWDLVGRGAAF